MNLKFIKNLNLFYIIINIFLIFFALKTDQFLKFNSNLILFIIFFFIFNLLAILIPSKLFKINYFFILIFSYFFLIIIEINYEKIFFKFCNNAKCKLTTINTLEKQKNLQIKLNLLPRYFIKNEKFLPLSSFTHQSILGSNENGYFSIHKTDEYGFFNKKDFYNEEIDLLMIGDSYLQGTTVYQDENIPESLNDLDLKTISLGMGGNGPLLTLASLIEYKNVINPKNILYFHTERNDLVYDLFEEKKNLLLLKYLLNDFSQDLVFKRDIINKKLEKLNSEIIINSKNNNKKINIINFLKLKNIRKIYNLVNIGPKNFYEKKAIKKELLEYKNINEAIKNNKDVSSNIYLLDKIIKKMLSVYPNANFYIFYLPTRENLTLKKKGSIQLNIDAIFQENNYNYIMLDDELAGFDKKFIKSLYPSNYEHFNKKGYSFISNLIYKKIISN